MKLVVGLGNPGAKYAGTRHNVGFEVVEYLAAAPGVAPFRAKFAALVADTTEGGEQILLAKPDTFMNLSGRAVRQIADFYKLGVEDILVVCDDFNLPLGKLRVRAKGSHGGQNGLRNIQECLGTDAYARLRVGVGDPGGGDAADFVLSKFRPGERPAVDDAVAKAAQAVLIWVRRGIDACMNAANGPEQGPGARGQGPEKKKEKKPKPESAAPPATDDRRPTNDE